MKINLNPNPPALTLNPAALVKPVPGLIVSMNPAKSTTAPEQKQPAASDLDIYRTLPPAGTDKVPASPQGLNYGSRSIEASGLVVGVSPHDFIIGALPMRPGVTDIVKSGVGNVFNPEWRQVVQAAVQQNGGLGDSINGFLAYSQDHGFVRFRNPRLTPEQNRRLAEISLVMGAPIEKMPSRSPDSAIQEPRIDRWVNEFIGRYDRELADFMADPSNGMSVREGRTRYKLEFNEQAGRVVSYHYKKAGGLTGFFQKAMKFLAPIADVASLVANFVPGLGTAVAFGAQALKTVGSMIATGGKFAATQIASLAGSALPWIGSKLGFGSLSGAQLAAGRGALAAGAELIDTGRIRPSTLTAAAAPLLISGLPGGPAADQAASQAAGILARTIETGEFDPGRLLPVLAQILGPATNGRETDPRISGTLDLLATALVEKRISPDQVIPWLGAFVEQALVPEDARVVNASLRNVVEGLHRGVISADQILNSGAADRLRSTANLPALASG